MTTLAGPAAAGTGAPPPAHARVKEPASPRFATWRNSWAVALRMARRDVRRHKGRSLIVLIMVGIPVALLTFGLSLNATANINGAERIPYELGTAAAVVQAPRPVSAAQNWDAQMEGSSSLPVKAVPGYLEEGTLAAKTAALSAYFHGTAVPMITSLARVSTDGLNRTMDIVAVDGRAGLGSFASLSSGRWPTKPGEVAVTAKAIALGAPSSGPVTYRINGETLVNATVVGEVDVADPHAGPQLFTLPDLNADMVGQWFILRNEPVTWSEVRAANQRGIIVLSAQVLRDPPPQSALDPSLEGMNDYEGTQQRQLTVIGGTILLLVTTLLVGPAFAVSAARSRRTLALAAANGAATSMLRRTVLAQALVLGALSALVGTGLGVLATWLASAYVLPALSSSFYSGPLDVPVLPVAGVTAVAIISAIIAALVPARRLGKIDISGVMKGQNVSPPLSRLVPIVGAVGAGVGGLMLFNAILTQQSEIPVVIGGVLLIVGALLLVPLCLVAIARLAARMPVALRMATRDAARQRTRSAPSVAAIVGALAALTMIGVGLSSDTEQQRRDYHPQAAPGEGYTSFLQGPEPGLDTQVAKAIHDADPAIQTSVIGNLQINNFITATPPTKDLQFVTVVPAGCTVLQTLDPNAISLAADPTHKPPCVRFGSSVYTPYGQIGIMDASTGSSLLGLTPAQSTAFRAGGAVVINNPDAGPNVRIAYGRNDVDVDTGAMQNVRVTKEITVPVAAHVNASPALTAQLQSAYGLVLNAEVAKTHGWEVNVDRLIVRDPNAPITPQREDRIRAAIQPMGADLYLERGFQRLDIIVMSIVVGIFVFLVLIITLTSTALSMAEQRKDDATLAALGATRRTRRGMAAAQAFALAAIGAVIGLVVGLVPGIAIAYPLTTSGGACDPATGVCSPTAPIIVIPWLWLGLAVIGTPLVAAAIAWLSVRRAPVITRRAT